MRAAIISAAGSGIGRALAEALHADGWRVHAFDRDPALVANLAAALGGRGAVIRVADVTDSAAVAAFVADVGTAEAATGRPGIDLVINNAGIAGPAVRFEEQPLDGWLACLDVNLNGMFYLTRVAIPLLRLRAPGSQIVSMGSNAGLFGCPLRAPYVAAKWALVGLTKTLAMELGPEGIRANAICPGSVEGPRIDRVIAADAAARGLTTAAVAAEYQRQASLRAFTRNADIVAMLRLLVSPGGERISGQALALDGHTEGLWLDLPPPGQA